MLRYPLELTPDDNDTFLVTCPLLPEVTSFGETEAEAVAMGTLAVEEAISARLARFADIPRPDGGPAEVSTLLSMKCILLWEMQRQGLTRADLVRSTGWARNQVDRLFVGSHATRLDQFDTAFRAIGRRVDVSVSPMDRAA